MERSDATPHFGYALSILRDLAGGSVPDDAGMRITHLAELLKGDLDAADDRRAAKAQVERVAEVLRAASRAANTAARAMKIAHAAIKELGDAAYMSLYGEAEPPANRQQPGHQTWWPDDPEQLLSGADHDDALDVLEKLAKRHELAAAQANPDRGESFLRSVMAKPGRPPALADLRHVVSCAGYLQELGLVHIVTKSEDGRFHDLVDAIAELAGSKSVSKQRLHAGVDLFRNRPKLDSGF